MSKTRKAAEIGLFIVGAIAGNGAIVAEQAQFVGHFWASNIGIAGCAMMLVSLIFTQPTTTRVAVWN